MQNTFVKLIKFKDLVRQTLGFKVDCRYKEDGLILSKNGIEFLCLHYDENGNVDLSDDKSQFYIREIKRVLDAKRNEVLQEITLVVTRTKSKRKIEQNFRGIKCLKVQDFVCTFKFKEGLVSSDFIKCLEISDYDLILNAKINMALQARNQECYDFEHNCYVVSTEGNTEYAAGLGLNEIYLNSWHSDVFIAMGSIKAILVARSDIGIEKFSTYAGLWFRSIPDNEKLSDCIYRYNCKTEMFCKVERP